VTYEIAKKIGLNTTYGILITQVTSGGPAEKAGLKAGTEQVLIGGSLYTVGGDVIIAINGNRIVNFDDLSTYLEENTLPNQTTTITIVRSGLTMDISVLLGTRPPLS
jgi:S1-C subfamily serine protease